MRYEATHYQVTKQQENELVTSDARMRINIFIFLHFKNSPNHFLPVRLS